MRVEWALGDTAGLSNPDANDSYKADTLDRDGFDHPADGVVSFPQLDSVLRILFVVRGVEILELNLERGTCVSLPRQVFDETVRDWPSRQPDKENPVSTTYLYFSFDPVHAFFERLRSAFGMSEIAPARLRKRRRNGVDLRAGCLEGFADLECTPIGMMI